MASTQAIEKLTGSNYYTWKFKMQMILTREDLWAIVSGAEVAPGPEITITSDKGESSTSITTATATAAATALAVWTKNDQKALATICLAIGDSELIHVRMCRTSAEAWIKLQTTFVQKGLSRQIYLRRQLYTLKLSEGDTIQQHINRLGEIVEQLANVGIETTDSDIAMSLLASLPESYETFIMALESCSEAITSEFVKSRLLQEEARRNEGNEKTALVSAAKDKGKKWIPKRKGSSTYLSAQPSQSYSSSSQGSPSNECFHCGKPGHYRKDCRRLLSEKQRTNAKTDNTRATEQSSKAAMLSIVEPRQVIVENVEASGSNVGKVGNISNVDKSNQQNASNKATNEITYPASTALFGRMNPSTPTTESERWYIDSGAT
jgi:hypothetical protein